MSTRSAALATPPGRPVIAPQTPESVGEDLGRVADALARRDTGFTIPSVVDNHAAGQRTFDATTAVAVGAVRQRVDPRGIVEQEVDPVRDRTTRTTVVG